MGLILLTDPAAPPKKPPRPGAPSHLSGLASLSSPGDSYNEGVKVSVLCRALSLWHEVDFVRAEGGTVQGGTAVGSWHHRGLA